MFSRQIINFLVLLFLIFTQHPAYAVTDKASKAAVDKASIDAMIMKFFNENPVNGMIYGLWINGEPVSVNAFGESMTAVPATPSMYIRSGGVTETMLTTILMHLVELQLVSLNDTLDQWYPQLPNAKLITLKMLANGTSGLQDFVYNKQFVEKATNQPFMQWTFQTLIAYAMNPPLFKPGTSQHYTHTDYVILANILSQVTHKPLPQLFDDVIFQKLNMDHAKFNSETADIPYPVLHAFSQDRSIYEDSTFWSPSWVGGSGGVAATINDMGKWANAWMRGDLLDEASTRQLRAPDNVGKGKNTRDLYFAMGFGVANHWLIQNPRFGGYSGVMAVLPERKIVFIAFNTLKPTKNAVGNLSFALWTKLAPMLAPDYPLPSFQSLGAANSRVHKQSDSN